VGKGRERERTIKREIESACVCVKRDQRWNETLRKRVREEGEREEREGSKIEQLIVSTWVSSLPFSF
jgi:hypothetical protein